MWRKGAYKILLGKTEGNRLLGIPTCRHDDNIKMNFKERGWQGMDWIHLAHGRGMWQAHVNMVMQGVWLGEELSASQRTLPCTVSMGLCWQHIIPALSEKLSEWSKQPHNHTGQYKVASTSSPCYTSSLPACVKCLFASTVHYAVRLQLQPI